MNIAMTSRRVSGLISLLLLLLCNLAATTVGYGFIGPTPTSVGLIGIQRMAPRPTRPPRIDENNGELRKRTVPDSILDAIPPYLCGFFEGNLDDPLTCRSSQTCTVTSSGSNTSVICSPNGDHTPTVYKDCFDSSEWATMTTDRYSEFTFCPSSDSPYCQLASFPSGEYILSCGSTTQTSASCLEYIVDWLATGKIPPSLTQTSHDSRDQTTGTPTMPTISYPITSTSSSKRDTATTVAPPPRGGLATAAIAGIGAAIGAVVVGAIAALGFCLFMRRHKRKKRCNQPDEISTVPSNPPMQQGNPAQGWPSVAPVSSSYPISQTAFLKSSEQPNPPYISEPASIYNPHSSPLSAPVTPYDSNDRTGSTGQYFLSQNPSATASPDNTIPPSFMSPVHNPGELPRFGNQPDYTAQPPSPISTIGYHGGGTRLGSPIDNQVYEMSTGFSLHNNPRGSGTGQSPLYHELSSSIVSPTSGNSRAQSPPSHHSIHEAPAAYSEIQAHGMVSSPTSSQRDGMSPLTPAAPSVVAPTPRINSGTDEGQQEAQYDTHKAPTTSHTAYSPEASPVTRGPLEVYHNNNAQ